MVLGGGLEPPRLTAYAPQTYVSAISPPELVQGREMFNTTYHGRKDDYFGRGLASPGPGGEPLWRVPYNPAIFVIS